MKRTATLVLAAIVELAACGDKRPTRPEDAAFRAMNEAEKCRVTTPRAVPCADEIIVAQVRTIPGLDNADEFASVVEKDNAKLAPLTRKARIEIHETSCAADRRYADAVFDCWAIEGCKPFAECVTRATAKPKRTRSGLPPIDDAPPVVDDSPSP